MVLYATEGNGKIARRIWEHQSCALVASFVTFPRKSHSPHLSAAHSSFLSSLGHYILDVLKTNECRKCNLLFSTKKDLVRAPFADKAKVPRMQERTSFCQAAGSGVSCVTVGRGWGASVCREFLQLRQK